MNIKKIMLDRKIEIVFGFALLLSLVIVFWRFISGEQYYIYHDIGSDTFFQYYPYYIHEVQAIRKGTFSLWLWNYGLGTAIQNVNAWTLDPFGVLLVLSGVIFGADKVAYLLVWMQIIKVAVVFALSKKFIYFFSDNRVAVNIGAYLVAMNGYLFLWGQHYCMGTAQVYILLLLIAIEHYIQRNCRQGGYYVAIVVAAVLVFSYYIGYMVLIFAAFYFVIRYLFVNQITFQGVILDWLKCIGWVVIGIFMSAVVFIPSSYYVMTNSSRLDSASSNIILRLKDAFFNSFNMSGFLHRLSRILSNNSLYINDSSKSYFGNYYEDPQLFCSIFLFVFVALWMFTKCFAVNNTKQVILRVLSVFGFVFLIFNDLPGVVLNGFVGVFYRYTFLLFPFLGIVVAQAWEYVHTENIKTYIAITIGFAISFGVWFYTWKNCSEVVLEYVGIVGIELLLGAVLFSAMLFFDDNKRLVKICIVALLFISTIAENYVTSNERTVVTVSDFEAMTPWKKGELVNDTARALAWLKQTDSSYYRVEKTYFDWAALSDSFIEQYAGVTTYNSTPNVNVAAYYDNIYVNDNNSYAIKWFNFDTDLQQRALDVAKVKYVLTQSEGFLNWGLIHTVGTVRIYKNPSVDSIVSWHTYTCDSKQFLNWTEDERAQFLIDGIVIQESYATNQDATANVGEFCVNGDSLFGTITCDGDGIVMMSIPDQEGWRVYVDDVQVHTINADFGFIGIPLSAGNHTIKAQYVIPKLGCGFCGTVIGFLLFTVCCYLEKRKK